MSIWKVKEKTVGSNGLKTTKTIVTEDSNIIRKIIDEPLKNNSSKDNKNNVISDLLKYENKTSNDSKKLDLKLIEPKKNEKVSLSRKSINGKAKIVHNTRNLSQSQVQASNYNSFNGNRGTNLKNDYEKYRYKIEFSGLSNSQKKKLLDKLYKMYEPILKYDSQWYSPMVSGPARYPQNKMDNIWNKMMQANSDFLDWWKEVEPIINNSKKSKKVNIDIQKKAVKKEIDELWSSFNKWFDEGRYFMCEYLLNDALKLDENVYKEMFNKLDSVMHYRKNTNLYKVYKKVIDGSVTAEKLQKKEMEDNSIIYQCSDYVIRNVNINAGKRIGISFTLRPKPQLVYALKSRGYTWYSFKSLWICKPEKFDLEWAKGISKQYEKYL